LLRLVVSGGCGIGLLVWGLWLRPVPTMPAMALVSANKTDVSSLRTTAGGDVPMPVGAAAAHASSLLAMPPGNPAEIALFWFSGERESGPLVQIAMSYFERATQNWAQPRFVVNRFEMGDQLGHGIRRLGNPVAWRDADGRIHLFVVATGWGGWAASRILHLRQSSGSTDLTTLQFEPVRVLPLSWLWNTSFLVRNAPMHLADGGMVLPVHFELGFKIPALLRFDAQGNFLGVVRMSWRNYALQPSVVAQTAQQWLAFMRDERPNGKVGVVKSTNGGLHWKDLPDLELNNPDASVAALAMATDQLMLAYNPVSSGRSKLDLSSSPDGVHWKKVITLAEGKEHDEFSYPAMEWVNGRLWLTYTIDRQRLAWQSLAPQSNHSGKPP
jgi:predicted neuraminidase